MNKLELKNKLNEINEDLKIERVDDTTKIYKGSIELVFISEDEAHFLSIHENLLESAKNKWIDTNQFGELFKVVIDYSNTELDYRENPNLIRNKITGEFLKQVKNNEEGLYYTHTTNSKDEGTLLYEVELKNNEYDLTGYDILDSEGKEEFFEENNKPGEKIDL